MRAALARVGNAVLAGLVFLLLLATAPLWIVGLLFFARTMTHEEEQAALMRGGIAYPGSPPWAEPTHDPREYLIYGDRNRNARTIAMFALAEPTDPRVPGEHYIPASRAESSERAQRILAAIRERGDNDRL